MEWLRELHGTVVGLDTAPLIYFVEEHPLYLPLVDPFFEAMARGDVHVVTSTVTLTEVLVHPYQQGNRLLASQYSDILLHAKNLKTVPVSAEIASEAARFRSNYALKTPDAIQLATAQLAGAFTLLTNDGDLPALPGLRLIVLDRLLAAARP
jgi:predicted nucleic acid-binding protein